LNYSSIVNFIEKETVVKKKSDKDFRNILKKFDMISDTGRSPGLVFVGEKPEDHSKMIAMEYAEKYGADAVYFRHFDDGRPPIPQVYIYDDTVRQRDEVELTELYKKLWNSSQIPLFFIFSKTEVKVFSCLKEPTLDKTTGKISVKPFENIKLASEIEKEIIKLRSFSARRFDNGTFWDQPEYKSNFNQEESVYKKLLGELKRTRREIIKSKILKQEIAERLIVMSILLKYLEEREDEDGSKVFPPEFFSAFSGDSSDTFIGVLKKKGACLKLFDCLSSPDRFNGEIFRWKDEKEREILKTTDMNAFADFFEGRLDNGQYTFWRLYSFNDLPIELISNIYEEFLESKPGVVYTPPYLVRFLIDEMMPLSDFDRENFKVLDPACGSGVFLVAAYRRMLHWWRIRNDWRKPGAENLDELKQILKKNIFGVDKEKEAIRLTFFSLSLALLDELSPKVIWENLKLDNLSENNLVSEDFFELLNDGFFQSDFDLVIGNPPFESRLTPEAEKIETQRIKERPELPDRQISLLFLDQAMKLCKSDAWLCLILPAGPFLYNTNTIEFRRYFFKKYDIPQITDFTFLSEILFESAKVAVVSVFAQNRESLQKDLLHVTVRRTKPAKNKLYFEVDHYDFHKVSYRDATESRLVWKANLLGGGRLQYLMKRFVSVRKLGDYLKIKENKDGWGVAEGFIIGNQKEIKELTELKAVGKLSPKKRTILERLEKKYKTADYLTGKKTLATEGFTEQGIDESQIYILKEKYFYCSASTKKEIFQGPHLLIKELAAKNSIPVELRYDDLSFKHEIIGIYAPDDQIDELKEIERRIKNNRIYLFYLAGFSGRYMIGRATAVLKKDIESLPFPEDEKELELTPLEQILVDDVLDYMLDFRRKGEKSVIEEPVSQEQLNQFAETYCRILNSVYKKFKAHQPIRSDSFICFPFYYKNKPEILSGKTDSLENDLYGLIKNHTNMNARIIRILRIYEKNTIFLIKPRQTRYWLRSIAIRDADETFSDLVIQGY
jgi:type I restriction-modification system DNA methylase subunit